MPTESKLAILFQSRKFWSLVAALAVDVLGVIYHGITPEVAILAAIGSLAAYSTATGIESAGQAQAAAVVKSASIAASVAPATVTVQPASTVMIDGHTLPPRG